MAPIILTVIAVAVLLFIVVVSSRPADFRVTRSTMIDASPASIFSHVNDLHRWAAWSPWEKLDPAMKKTHEGAPAGVGAIYTWSGNNKVGEGRMTILESRSPGMVRIQLGFLRPFKATNTTEFIIKLEGAKTTVEWNMTGKNNFIAKAFGLFVNTDKMVGKDFEKGLAQLKAVVEA